MSGLIPVTASTIQVSNLGNASTFTGATSSGSPIPYVVYAGKFTTDAHGYLLEAAKAVLGNSNTPSNGLATFEARLYSDAGVVPGSLLMTFNNSPTLPVGSGLNTLDFTTATAFALSASTSYWLAIRNTTGGYIGWAFTSDDAQTSPGAWTIDNSAVATSNNTGANWTDQSGLYGSYVPKFAILTSSVPESGSTFALFGLTLAGVAGFRRKFAA